MGYDRDVSFPFDFEPNGIPFRSKSKGELSSRSYPIQCERKYIFLSVTITQIHAAIKTPILQMPEDTYYSVLISILS